MSGLAAIIHAEGQPADPALIRAMTSAMSHRGPDGISRWSEGPAALGQCLMATTAGMRGAGLDGTDPDIDPDTGRIAVIAGYLADRKDLATSLDLDPEAQSTLPDSEMLLAAFARWGRDCGRHLRGAFAGLIWDRAARTLFAVRDHLGQKPLHYHWNGQTLSVASDASAILALPWVDARPNYDFAAELLALTGTSRGETIWSGVHRLPPAHCLTLGGQELRISPYWSPMEAPRIRHSSEAGYVEHYLGLLTDVTRRHAETDRPLACEVSGGLDSSAIFALADKLRDGGSLPAPALHGFTLDFGDHPDANDLAFARSVAGHLGAEIAEIKPRAPDVHWFVESSRRNRDFPGFPNGTMNTSLMKAARDLGCRAILNGGGGDEWLAGSAAVYTDAVASADLAVLGACFRSDRSHSGLRKAMWNLMRHGVSEHLPAGLRAPLVRLRRRLRGSQHRFRWIAPEYQARLTERQAEGDARLRDCPTAVIADLEATRLDGFHPSTMEMFEREAAWLGVEYRSPFHDPDLVDFAYGTPGHLHWCGGPIKALHRKAMGDLLPPQVRDRRGKADFSFVFDNHLALIPARTWRDIGDRLAPLLGPDLRRLLDDLPPDPHRAPAKRWRLWVLYALDLAYQ